MSKLGDRIRTAFDRVHRYATKQTKEPYMSIPVDKERDADCIVIDGIAELERELAAAVVRNAVLEGMAQDVVGHVKILMRYGEPDEMKSVPLQPLIDALADTSEAVRELLAKAKTAEPLWQLLDDIDTLDDAAKGDDKAFRAQVRRVQQKRHEYAKSDGYSLEFVDEAGEGEHTE